MLAGSGKRRMQQLPARNAWPTGSASAVIGYPQGAPCGRWFGCRANPWPISFAELPAP